MELGLSLGENHNSRSPPFIHTTNMNNNKGLGFCMSLGLSSFASSTTREVEEEDEERHINVERQERNEERVQLDLLPLAPVPRNHVSSLPWLEKGNSEAGSSGQLGGSNSVRGFDVNMFPLADEHDDGDGDGAAVSSPNSTVSSFQIDFSMYRNKRDSETAGLNEDEPERTTSRGSDDDENGSTRKKLRLSKEQSVYLEESFKEHNTLNPKQKLALAKQLNLRPRQVEVWFQNRRARTKLKQTEVDCEYLKRCCDTLTEENRRLQKEIHELRALKTSHPYYMQLPATTLTMCPSCERVATTTTTTNTSTPTTSGPVANSTTTTTNANTNANTNTTTNTTTNTATASPMASAFSLTKPRFYPFSLAHPLQSVAPS